MSIKPSILLVLPTTKIDEILGMDAHPLAETPPVLPRL